MKTIKYFLLASILLLTPIIYADEPLDTIQDFFKQTNIDIDKAMEQLIKGSSMEGNREALSQSNVIRQMQSFVGKYKDLEVFKEVDVSTKNKVIFVTAHHEDGVAYGFFNYYLKNDDKWILQSFSFNTEIQKYGEFFFAK